MDPDNAQHFNLNLPSAVDKVIGEIALAGKHLYSVSLMYIPNSLFLVNSLNLNCRHKPFTY